MKIAAPLLALMLATPALAAPLSLTPANPQPDAGDLSPGLAVKYAYPSEVRTVATAAGVVKKGRSGPPLKGLSYNDTTEGDLVLTSRGSFKVAADISGFIKFDAPGTYAVNIFSNDGILASIGGQQVALHDGIHACEPAGVQEVSVPSAGWYEVQATYFQRKGTSCLTMDWNVGGGMQQVPDSAFGHLD